MYPGRFLQMVAVAVLCQFAIGWASQKNPTTTTTASADKPKGHWETLPPETGSMLPRKVWVDDSGNANGAAGASSVQTGSGHSLDQSQRNSGFMRSGAAGR